MNKPKPKRIRSLVLREVSLVTVGANNKTFAEVTKAASLLWQARISASMGTVEASNRLGCSLEDLAAYESGKAEPSEEFWAAASALYGVSLDAEEETMSKSADPVVLADAQAPAETTQIEKAEAPAEAEKAAPAEAEKAEAPVEAEKVDGEMAAPPAEAEKADDEKPEEACMAAPEAEVAKATPLATALANEGLDAMVALCGKLRAAIAAGDSETFWELWHARWVISDLIVDFAPIAMLKSLSEIKKSLGSNLEDLVATYEAAIEVMKLKCSVGADRAETAPVETAKGIFDLAPEALMAMGVRELAKAMTASGAATVADLPTSTPASAIASQLGSMISKSLHDAEVDALKRQLDASEEIVKNLQERLDALTSLPTSRSMASEEKAGLEVTKAAVPDFGQRFFDHLSSMVHHNGR